MSDSSDIIKQMAECVRSEMNILKALKAHEDLKADDYDNQLRKKSLGCLFSMISYPVTWLGERSLKKLAKKRNFSKFNKDAENLLANREIKNAICRDLSERSQKEFLTEDVFIETITGTLGEYNLRTRHSIEWNHILFAYVAFNISEIGYANFCNKTK